MRLAVHHRKLPARMTGVGLVCALLILPLQALADDDGSYSLSQMVGQVGSAVQGEILKATSAQKAVAEGLATYRAQARLQNQAVNLQNDMKQSDQLCQAMGSQDALATGARASRAAVYSGQKTALSRVTKNTNTLAVIDASYKTSNANFCTDTEVAQGICKPTSNAKYVNLAGADQNAMYLFQSRTGGDTYEGLRDGPQVDGVNAYIARVVAGAAPPEQLRDTGATAYAKSPQARIYAESLRRYTAFLSMATFSLNQIKESRNPAAK